MVGKVFYFYRILENGNRIEECINDYYHIFDCVYNMDGEKIEDYRLEIWEFGELKARLHGEDMCCEEFSEFTEIIIEVL